MSLHLELLRLKNSEVVAEYDPCEPLPFFDEMAGALQGAFPTDAEKLAPKEGLPPPVARFALTSKNSQLLVAGHALRFNVQYFGNFETNTNLARDYVNKKVGAALRFLAGKTDIKIRFIGVVHHLDVSAGGMDFDPAQEVAGFFLNDRTMAAATALDDMELRLGLKWKDRYFLNYSFQNYRTHSAQVQILGAGPGVLKSVAQASPDPIDVGIRIKVDLNTKHFARQQSDGKAEFEVEEVGTMLDEAEMAISQDLPQRFGGAQ